MPNNILKSDEGDHRSVLASVDSRGRRKGLLVAIIPGFWRRCRTAVAAVLICFYLAAPLVSINGMPMVRIDIPNRHYILFGHIFWPQDFFYFLLMFLTAIISTVALVSLLGRVFCGWICPHNVFLEIVYRPIERFFEGPAHRQRLNNKRGLSNVQRLRRFAKWITFALVSGALANTATALFVGTDAFIAGIFIDPIAHPGAAIFFMFAFAFIYFNFVWFREQLCTIICPYGRLQSALLDSESLIVGYDHRRGDPRGKVSVATNGDCVDCHQCVDVCPTGIYIRNGTQMECIQCSACIDACNSVMTKLERPINLIGYTSENGLAGRPRRLIRPRTLLYMIVLTCMISLTSYVLYHRPLIQMTRMRDGTQIAVNTYADGHRVVTTNVRVAIINKSARTLQATYAMPGEPDVKIIAGVGAVQIPANAREVFVFRVLVPEEPLIEAALDAHIELRIPDLDRLLRIPVRLPRHEGIDPSLDTHGGVSHAKL